MLNVIDHRWLGGGYMVNEGSRTRRKDQAREEILAAAARLFEQSGYEGTSLAEVGAAVGLTRGAVLYHFSSKAELLDAMLGPFVTTFESRLAEWEQADPTPHPRQMLGELFDLLLESRAAIYLITRDVSGRQALEVDNWVQGTFRRLIILLSPPRRDDPHTRLRGIAALGALTRCVIALPVVVSPGQRTTVIEAAYHALAPATDPDEPYDYDHERTVGGSRRGDTLRSSRGGRP
jgi:AcrR family transcriptional regulator